MAHYEISNLRISNNRLVIGDTVTIGLTLKNVLGSGKTIKRLGFVLRAKSESDTSTSTGYYVARLTEVDVKVSLANNKSQKFEFTATIEGSAALQDALNANYSERAFALMLNISASYVESGDDTTYGVYSIFDIADAYIMRSRCNPTISKLELERALNGAANDEGINVLTTLQLSMADTSESGNMSLMMYYAQGTNPATTTDANINLTNKIQTLLSGVTDDSTIITDTFSNSSDWDFMLVFGDQYESVTVHTALFRAFANMHLSGASTGGVCYGGFSSSTEGNPKLESYYPVYPYKGIKGVTDYRDSEQQAYGTWINGKPIYRKTVSLEVGSADATATSSVLSSDMETAAAIDGIFVRTSDGKQFPTSFYRSDETYVDCQITADHAVSVKAAWPGTAYVTVFYTHASDPSSYDAAMLLDSDGNAVEDVNGDMLTVAADADTVQLAHSAAQLDQAVDRAETLYTAYTSGELKGDKGDTGPAGADGYTPILGTDYFTSADKAQIVSDVLAALPVYAGEVEDA